MVYRDANRDDKYDYYESSAEWGLFGINIHRASKWGIVNYINRFSAGCQVFKDPEDFGELMELCKKSLKYFVNPKGISRFSYTLVEGRILNT